LCTLATGGISLVAAASVATAPERHRVVVTITPRVVLPYLWATVSVAGVDEAAAVEIRMLGASSVNGRPIPWIPLHRRSTAWQVRLPQSVLPGIYPIAVRTRPLLDLTPTRAVYLRVYEAGTSARPLFATPRAVVDWWVANVAGGTVVAIRRWPRTSFDHRLVELHRLFVVAYNVRGRPAAADRLGAWITAVREGYDGKWRLLEVSVSPP
jgi:hypothetical protein